MTETLIIADIAGQFDALLRLVDLVPTSTKVLAVGDLNDRGPASAHVIDWFMKEARADAVAANHEHMMLDYYRKRGMYGTDGATGKHIWLYPGNGGNKTVASYYRPPFTGRPPEEHLKWLETRDFYKFVGEHNPWLVTHAPLNPQMELFAANEACQITSVYHPDFDKSLMWNRRQPIKRSFFQVFGHCAEWGLRPFYEPGSDKAYAICIDQSHKRKLTGIIHPTGEILEVPYGNDELRPVGGGADEERSEVLPLRGVRT